MKNILKTISKIIIAMIIVLLIGIVGNSDGDEYIELHACQERNMSWCK